MACTVPKYEVVLVAEIDIKVLLRMRHRLNAAMHVPECNQHAGLMLRKIHSRMACPANFAGRLCVTPGRFGRIVTAMRQIKVHCSMHGYSSPITTKAHQT